MECFIQHILNYLGLLHLANVIHEDIFFLKNRPVSACCSGIGVYLHIEQESEIRSTEVSSSLVLASLSLLKYNGHQDVA